MENALTISAVCGWAIPRGWFERQVRAAFPAADVHALYPLNPQDSREAAEWIARHPAGLWIGYSLGSLWLMHHRERLPAAARAALLAPILAFPKEGLQGGKTARGQLNYLIKILRRDPENRQPVLEFLKQMTIEFEGSETDPLPAAATLVRGLEFLRDTVETPRRAAGWIALTGEDDPLLESARLEQLLPGIQVVPRAGHHPGRLLRALAEHLRMPANPQRAFPEQHG